MLRVSSTQGPVIGLIFSLLWHSVVSVLLYSCVCVWTVYWRLLRFDFEHTVLVVSVMFSIPSPHFFFYTSLPFSYFSFPSPTSLYFPHPSSPYIIYSHIIFPILTSLFLAYLPFPFSPSHTPPSPPCIGRASRQSSRQTGSQAGRQARKIEYWFTTWDIYIPADLSCTPAL